MRYISILTLFIIFMTGLKVEKSFFSPMVSFAFLFLLVFILASFGWFGIYVASSDAFLLIALGVLMFSIGTIAARKYIGQNDFSLDDGIDSIKERNYNFMLLVCLFVLSSSVFMVFSYIASGKTLGDLYIQAAAATDGAENVLSKSSFQILLESYVAYPLLYLLIPVSLVEFFHSYKKKYLFVALFLALTRILLDARRTYLVIFMMMFILCAILHRKDLYRFSQDMFYKIRKIRKQLYLLAILFGLFFIFISQQRSLAENGVDKSNTLRTLTYYYGGSVQFFYKCIETHSGSYTFGVSTLRGFFAPIFGILNIFGFETPDVLKTANMNLTSLHATVMNIAPSKVYNSFATAFYQFYCDFGVFGIIFISFLYGYLAQYLYNNMVYYKTKISEARYVFFYANILMLSFVNIQTVLALNFWPLILVRFLYKGTNEIYKSCESDY